jgi:catalase-peroxidase
VLKILEGLRDDFNETQPGGKKISLADLIVLGGCAGVEEAAKRAGHRVTVPFTPGRTDASQTQTDIESFAVLEPVADGFRNYTGPNMPTSAEEMLLDKAQLLTLTAPEMTVLLGGMRVLNTNVGKTKQGILTRKPETLSNDFFVNLLDMRTSWKATSDAKDAFEARDAKTGRIEWTASRVDLVIGSNAQLRALAEVYGSADAQEKFVHDFIAVWSKVMNLDRYDVLGQT